MCMFVLPGCISVYHMCTVITEDRRGHWLPLDWSYRLLWMAMWMLSIKPESCRRATCALNHWCISPALYYYFKNSIYAFVNDYAIYKTLLLSLILDKSFHLLMYCFSQLQSGNDERKSNVSNGKKCKALRTMPSRYNTLPLLLYLLLLL